MVINKEYLMKKGLSPYDLLVLALIYQNATEDMHEDILLYMEDENLKRYQALDLITTVKAKRKSDHDFVRLRLSKKGKEVYKNAQIADYTEQDENLLKALSELYLSVDKPVGNDVKVKGMISWFRTETQYSRKMIYLAIKIYLQKLVDQDKVKYIPTLENLFWKGKSVFSAKWNLGDSKIYQFIQENKQELNAYTTSKTKNKEGES